MLRLKVATYADDRFDRHSRGSMEVLPGALSIKKKTRRTNSRPPLHSDRSRS